MFSQITQLITIARDEQGMKEVNPGSNIGPDITKYAQDITGYSPGLSWCVAFVHWCLQQIQVDDIPDTLSVSNFFNFYSTYYPERIITKGFIMPGDLALRVSMEGFHDHIGIVTRTDTNDYPLYISGNTTNPKIEDPKLKGDYYVCEKPLKKYNAIIRLFSE